MVYLLLRLVLLMYVPDAWSLFIDMKSPHKGHMLKVGLQYQV